MKVGEVYLVKYTITLNELRSCNDLEQGYCITIQRIEDRTVYYKIVGDMIVQIYSHAHLDHYTLLSTLEEAVSRRVLVLVTPL